MNTQFSLPFQTFNICVVYIDFQMISNLIWLDNACHNHKARVSHFDLIMSGRCKSYVYMWVQLATFCHMLFVLYYRRNLSCWAIHTCVVYIEFQLISNFIWLGKVCHNHKTRVWPIGLSTNGRCKSYVRITLVSFYQLVILRTKISNFWHNVSRCHVASCHTTSTIFWKQNINMCISLPMVKWMYCRFGQQQHYFNAKHLTHVPMR